MKMLSLSSLLLVCSFVHSHSAPELTDQWLAQSAREVAEGFLLPGKGAAPDLRLAEPGGVALGEAPTTGDDKKSLEFTGEQTAAFRTEKGYARVNTGLRVMVDVKPGEEIAETDGTILRHGTSWELRHVSSRGVILFIIWHDANDYTEVRVPARPGEWQTFEAEYEEGRIAITNGTDTAEAVPHTAMRMETSDPPLLLGASNPLVLDPESGRPFVGAVANIRIGIE
jgi:hypothetical protein